METFLWQWLTFSKLFYDGKTSSNKTSDILTVQWKFVESLFFQKFISVFTKFTIRRITLNTESKIHQISGSSNWLLIKTKMVACLT